MDYSFLKYLKYSIEYREKVAANKIKWVTIQFF